MGGEKLAVYKNQFYEGCRRNGVKEDTVNKKGKLPYHKIGTRIIFTESDLNYFLELCAIPSNITPTEREKRNG
jgi:hypothetical protein